MLKLSSLTLAFILGPCIPALNARAAVDPTPGLDAFINELMDQYLVPGAAVALVKDGQVVFDQGYGARHVGRPDQVDTDTVFQIASVTKSFSATLVGVMVGEGRMDWDQPLVEVLPGLRLAEPYATAHVTARDLLVHRSGLPALTGDLFDALGYSRGEVIARIRHMPLSSGFRENAAYSNLGVFLAGEAAARVGGGRWEEVIRSRLLAPMKLINTGFHTGPVPSGSNMAFPHVLADGIAKAFPAYDAQAVLAPAGLMTSSASDLGRFMRMLLDRGTLDGVRILEEAVVDELFKPVIAEEPGFAELPPIDAQSGFDYSPGWGIYHFNGLKVVEKGGARTGMRALVTLVPEARLGIAVLCNLNGTAFPEAVRAYVLERVAGPGAYDLQQSIRQRQAQLDDFFAGVSVEDAAVPEPVAPLSSSLDVLVGDYDNPLYGRLRVRREGIGLRWEIGAAQYGGTMMPLGHSTFLMALPPGLVPGWGTFVLDAKGVPRELQTEDFGNYRRVESTRTDDHPFRRES